MSIACKANNKVLFTITNNGGAMLSSGTYTVTNLVTGQTTTSNLQLAAGGPSSFITVGNAQVTVQYATNDGNSLTLQATAAFTPPPTTTRTHTRRP